MIEAVRLVIWDLDDTFWRGTVTEGGIEEYIQEHHDIVVELARRGIMSSVCSKNDEGAILKILEEKGILQYLIFPSVSWEPKGNRLAQLIDVVQLRPATVMFVDDNPSNRAEARAFVPDMQVEDETFILKMLEDPRFIGKDDSKLTRLAQYKLLEYRRKDEKQATGSNQDFLRSCDVRVYIEYDIAAHLDRAVELINRTNQLNFTKRRLPDDPKAARTALLEEIKGYTRQAGLIRVIDNYGDYGFVGIFVVDSGRREHMPGAAFRTLRHFCFSCRTLGLLVERWVYDLLGRPSLTIVGEVLTDLNKGPAVDWVRQVQSLADKKSIVTKVAPEIRLYGGCEANAVGVYMAQYSDTTEVWGNFAAGGLFVRVNSAGLALSSFRRAETHFAKEAELIGLPIELSARDYLATAKEGTVFIFSCALDGFPGVIRYRHRSEGWELVVHPLGNAHYVFMDRPDEDLQAFGTAHLDQLIRVARHMRAEYDVIRGFSDEEKLENTRALLDLVPIGSKFVLLLDHDRIRGKDGVSHIPFITRYNALMKAVVLEYPYAAIMSFADVVEDDSQIQIGGNHYDRVVYLKLAERIVEVVRNLPARAAN